MDGSLVVEGLRLTIETEQGVVFGPQRTRHGTATANIAVRKQNTLSTSCLSRRDFLRRTSMFAISTSVLIEHARGQSRQFVVAETSLGKIRDIENRGIKILQGIPLWRMH
jgi:hypothetical protein